VLLVSIKSNLRITNLEPEDQERLFNLAVAEGSKSFDLDKLDDFDAMVADLVEVNRKLSALVNVADRQRNCPGSTDIRHGVADAPATEK
jgi:hypothetical protein